MIEISSWPSFTQEEADKVSEVLLSNKVNYWTGTEGREFEREFAKFSDCAYAIAVANGTVALDLALKALCIGEGDEVVVTPRTFLASVSAIVNAGAMPVFADVDCDSQNITPKTVRKVLSPKTKAIVCVHLAGWPCDMDGFMQLAAEHELKIIEDCAQAHGAKYIGTDGVMRSVGSIGHVGAWSFCQDKIMTIGGEGGMVTVNDKTLWQKMWSFKDHGKSYDLVYNKEHPPGFRWLHESFGTNWRLTEMQSAIGRIQLTRMAEWTEARTRNANLLADVCRKFEFLRVPDIPPHIIHANYKLYVFVEIENLPAGLDRDGLIALINEAGIPSMQGSCSEVYLEKAFDKHPSKPKARLPVAKELGETSLMFLVHPTISEEQIKDVCGALETVLSSIL
ncbi:MAG: DegT/DnrJ/EryC1/StrS aminotransferase family protein [Oleiphilaceae bacterium]|nr:DegT/DnrJ/EryC1/StrS aminotransferase family protein [Oleiphilaceae bacterium]